jgi:hypothetical protein
MTSMIGDNNPVSSRLRGAIRVLTVPYLTFHQTVRYLMPAGLSAHPLFLCVGTQKLEVRYFLRLQNLMIIAVSLAMPPDTIFSLCHATKSTSICVLCANNL